MARRADQSDVIAVSARKKRRADASGQASSPSATIQLQQELEAASAHLEQLQRQLEHADRLASLGTLAATIAHEFNNILTPCTNWAHLALRAFEAGKPDLELTQRALSKCHAAGLKAGRICESILNLARAPEVRPDADSSCDVAAVVAEALSALTRDPAQDGIILRIQVEPGLRAGICPLQLEHVIVNLILNAKQAMSGLRGCLTIQACAEPGDARFAKLEITDTGRGIEPAELPRIFESFYTTRTEAGPARGTGLGLSLCRTIIERHGGQISASSKSGKGTTFRIRLPMERAAAAPASLAA